MFSICSNCALNYEKIKWNTERVSNIKPFINKYNWKEINYPSINILYTKEKEIFPASISKINSNCEKQIILLMIPNAENEGWNYLYY